MAGASALDVLTKKRASVIGVGRLGVCLALVLERGGWDVCGVDASPTLAAALRDRTLRSSEPMVTEYLAEARRLRVGAGVRDAVEHSDLIFIVVATPTGPDGAYDVTTLSSVLSEINALRAAHKHVVVTCTVPPGYTDGTGRGLLRDCPGATLSYNPVFVAQGTIVADLERPDCILVGEGSAEAGELLLAAHGSFARNEPRGCRMSPASAELAKLAVNCFVTTKVAFANMVADVADRTPGADKDAVLRAVGSDARVGAKFLRPGYGFGGPCLPRDNRALGAHALKVGVTPAIPEATDAANEEHARLMARALLDQGLARYTISDVAYKSRCPVESIEESQPLVVARLLVEAGKTVTIRDREGIVALCRREYGDTFLYDVVAGTASLPEGHGAVAEA